jgi:UDP-N-acetylmuramoyl-tripeptide--D-alanyl-D-alanine ligase
MKELFELFYATSGVCTDTRKIEKNCLFICLKGENFNGNTFAESALEEGAKYVIVDEVSYQTNASIFLVENCLLFLQQLASFHRSKFDIPVIGITGSNGKTSTKELVNCVLSQKYTVLSTIGNLNNHIGVPLTLLRLTEDHQIALIEMGANKFKDIAELCAIAKPTLGIITNIGKAHLEGFKDFNGVLATKKELYTSVSEQNGIIVYNNDDTILIENKPESVEEYSYGTHLNSFVRGKLIGLSPYIEMTWSHKDYDSPVIHTQTIGKYNFYNFLAAITFGVILDVPHEKINQAIQEFAPDNNRSQVKITNENTLILDCYNANPSSMLSALESFELHAKKEKIFILGDMLELGEESHMEHQHIASFAEKAGLRGYTVGPLFKAVESPNFIKQFLTKQEALHYFSAFPLTKNLILLKGSRGIGLEILETRL